MQMRRILFNALVTCAVGEASITWLTASDLGVGGRAFDLSGDDDFARLPSAARADISQQEYLSSRTPTGLFVQFQTDASAIYLRYHLSSTNIGPQSYIPPNGWSGSDIFRYDNDTSAWRWVATTFHGLAAAASNGGFVEESPLFADSAGWPQGPAPSFPTLNGTYTYRLHLPNFAVVSNVSLGVPSQATLRGDASWDGPVRVTYIGGQVAQGGVTGRPGQVLTHRLSRALKVPVHNMGFGGGACQLEAGLAKWMSQAAKTGVFIVDCAAEMDSRFIATATGPFVQALLAARPGVPVLLVEPPPFRPSWALGGDPRNMTAKRAALRVAYNALLSAGVTGAHYQTGEGLTASYPEWDEPSFDGALLMDDAHRVVAATLAPVLAALLGGTAPAPAPVPTLTPPPAQPGPVTRPVGPGAPSIAWTPAEDLAVANRGFPTSVLPGPFNRLPSAAKGVVRSVVWDLGLDSAGIAIGFTTGASEVWVNYTADAAFSSDMHFPATGISGLDLYGWDDATGRYRFIATANLTLGVTGFVGPIVTGLQGPRRFLLYLPTYNHPTRLSVGVPTGASLAPDAPWPAETKPIVWYGTSILQGGVAFRPGAITTSIVSRVLNVPILNFGFSGNCWMEPDVVRFIVNATPSGSPPAAFVLDCNPNMNATGIMERAVPVVTMVRQAWPGVPIFMAEGPRMGRSWTVPDDAALEAGKNAALSAAYADLTASGMGALSYALQTDLYTPASWLDSPTNAGEHPLDQGMRDLAAYWVRTLAGPGP